MSEDGIEQDQAGYPFGVSDGVEDGIGTGRIVTDENRAGYAEFVEDRCQFERMVLGRESGRVRPIGPAVSEKVEGHGPPRGQQRQ